MVNDRVVVTDEQAKKFAAIVFPDVKEYVETHKANYIVWCDMKELEKAA